MQFYVQMQAPAGNWYDILGTNFYEDARQHAEWYFKHFQNGTVNVRIIERKEEIRATWNTQGDLL